LGILNEWIIRPEMRAYKPQDRDNTTLWHISPREGMVRPEIILTRMVWPTDRRVVLHYSDPEGRSLFETMFKMHDITNFNPRHEVEYGY